MKQRPARQPRHSAPVAPLPDSDLSQWGTEKEVEDRFKMKERTLNRRVKAGLVQKRMFPRPGRVPEARYYIPDLERLTAVEGFPMPATDQALAPRAAAQPPPLSLERFAQVLLAAAPQQQGPAAPSRPPALWADLEAASELTGLSQRLLRKLIRTEQLPALRDGKAWKICRSDLHGLRDTLRAKRAGPATMARSVGGAR